MKREQAIKFRRTIEAAAALQSDEAALDNIYLYPKWEAGIAVNVGERYRYGDTLYKCVQAHTSQTDWTPDATPALWTEVAEPGTIPVWRQPSGAQDAYRIGDKVHYPDEDGPVYISVIDYNTYAPNVYGWELES